MWIEELNLRTTQLQRQKDFYTQTLGLELYEEQEGSFTLRIGRSLLKFEQSQDTASYHFAFNIPSPDINSALYWLQQRVDILSSDKENIQDFPNWNAQSLYFYDADRNIVEFIARKNLNIPSDTTFDSHSLKEISEIGLPCQQLESSCSYLQEMLDLAIYDGDYSRFCALGTEHALFICIDSLKKKTWFPTNDRALFVNFKITLNIDNQTVALSASEGHIHLL
jgi:catechol-2,3-dioxygenase